MQIQRYFPNTSTLAYYDFLNQIVNINSFDLEKLQQQKSLPDYVRTNLFIPLCQHEYTHWLDSTSTIWGMKFLNTLYKTYDVEDFREFLKGNIDLKNLHQLIYNMRSHHYHLNSQSIEDKKNSIPWKYQYQYDVLEKRYILPIVNFLNKDNNSIICSVPISTLSILEASATAQELAMRTGLILSFLDNGEKVVETKLHEQEVIKQIYNPRLTEYSVAVHIVANSINLEDILQAYAVCAVLSRFVLNFPAEYYGKVSLQNSIEQLDFLTAENVDMFENTLHEQNDMSLLFFIIARKLQFETFVKYNNESIQKAIINIMKSLGIDINRDFHNSILKEYNAYSKYFNTYSYQPIEDIVSAGKENFETLGIFGQWFYDFHSLVTPKALLGDDSEFPCYTNFMKTFSPMLHKEHLYAAANATSEVFKMMIEE